MAWQIGKAKSQEITRAVITVLKYGEESVSVAMEEVEPNAWTNKVYKPEILASRHSFIRSQDILLCERAHDSNRV